MGTQIALLTLESSSAGMRYILSSPNRPSEVLILKSNLFVLLVHVMMRLSIESEFEGSY